MSVTVTILPTKAMPIQTRLLEARLYHDALFIHRSSFSGGFLGIRRKHEGRLVDAGEVMDLETGSYLFETRQGNALSLFIYFPEGDLLFSEDEIVDGLSSSMSHQAKGSIARQYQKIGYQMDLYSYAARTSAEPGIFVALAACLAEDCRGFIAILDMEFFPIPQGLEPDRFIFTPDEFRRFEPTFTGMGPCKLHVSPREDSIAELPDGSLYIIKPQELPGHGQLFPPEI
jgi:hypothetical protein